MGTLLVLAKNELFFAAYLDNETKTSMTRKNHFIKIIFRSLFGSCRIRLGMFRTNKLKVVVYIYNIICLSSYFMKPVGSFVYYICLSVIFFLKFKS